MLTEIRVPREEYKTACEFKDTEIVSSFCRMLRIGICTRINGHAQRNQTDTSFESMILVTQGVSEILRSR